MTHASMTLDQAKQKIECTLRTLRKINKFTASERKAIPTRAFGDDFTAIRQCIWNNVPNLRSSLPDISFEMSIHNGPPSQPYIEFLTFYE
jgi:hypothetical protein